MKDYANWYESISAPFRAPRYRTAIKYSDKGLVVGFAVTYIVGLAVLFARSDEHALRFLLVPAAIFALVTVARMAIDEKRPYEQYDIDPLIVKDTKGKSMPSRHMASATAIACAYCWLCMPIGLVAVLGCAAVSFTRIVGGVHFPRDIAVAAAIAVLASFFGYAIIV